MTDRSPPSAHVEALGKSRVACIGDLMLDRFVHGRVEPHLLVERGHLSTEKTRFVADGQQLLRADSETTEPIAARAAESLAGLARDALATCDAMALSDYGKGCSRRRWCAA